MSHEHTWQPLYLARTNELNQVTEQLWVAETKLDAIRDILGKDLDKYTYDEAADAIRSIIGPRPQGMP